MMRSSSRGILIVGAALAVVMAGASPPAFGSAPKAACELVSAAAVSTAVGEQVQLMTTSRSPKSLCVFGNFPRDVHATTKDWQPHFRSVTVALFNAATMSDRKVGSTMARVGCRTVVAKCQKALADRSPEELYNAEQPVRKRTRAVSWMRTVPSSGRCRPEMSSRSWSSKVRSSREPRPCPRQ